MRLNPIFDEVSQEYAERIKFTKLNILESPTNQEIATNMGIMSAPTFVLFCNGRSVGQVIGFHSSEGLKEIDEMLARYKMCIKQNTDLKGYIV